MVFHGNASSVYSNHDIFRDLINQGYGVWSVTYPGYPGGEGKPTQEKLTLAAQWQYDLLLAKGIKPENIIFYGTSLGSGVAAQLAVTHKPALLIMDAPFNSVLDMGRIMGRSRRILLRAVSIQTSGSSVGARLCWGR